MVPVRVGIPRRRRGWGRGGVEGRPVSEEDVSGHDGGAGRGGLGGGHRSLIYTRGDVK